MIDPRARLPPRSSRSPGRHTAAQPARRVPHLLGRVRQRGGVPESAVAVFFATGPENFYQFEQWRLPLEHLALQRPVFVIVDRPDTGDLVLQASSLPLAFARGSVRLKSWSLIETSGLCSISIRSRRTSACCGSPARCTSRSGTAKATRAGVSPTNTRRTT